MYLIFVLTLAGGLCYICFICPIFCWCCPEVGTGSINWTQLSKLSPEDRDRIQYLKLAF
jgi:hypothetical protein